MEEGDGERVMRRREGRLSLPKFENHMKQEVFHPPKARC